MGQAAIRNNQPTKARAYFELAIDFGNAALGATHPTMKVYSESLAACKALQAKVITLRSENIAPEMRRDTLPTPKMADYASSGQALGRTSTIVRKSPNQQQATGTPAGISRLPIDCYSMLARALLP